MRNLIKALSVSASRFTLRPAASLTTGTNEPSTTGIRAWLLNGVGYSSVSKSKQNEIVVECVDTSWAEANASDLVANREAAFESLLPRQHQEYGNEAVAWPVITCYYSAYYSAQTFLRCQGLGSLYLEGTEADTINSAWKAKGFSAEIESSNYIFQIDLSKPVTTVRISKIGGKGGAHQQFWNGFQKLQSNVHWTLLSSPTLNILSQQERQSAHVEYKNFIDLCFSKTNTTSSSHDFGWLSKLRNEINYRFTKHLWLMNRRHSAGLISNHQRIIDRYSNGDRSPPTSHRNFSHTHLVYVATRFHKLIRKATSTIAVD
jgi:hypothetical protein